MRKIEGKSEKGKIRKKKKAEIRLFISTIQMVQESSRTDPYSPIFGHINVLHLYIYIYIYIKGTLIGYPNRVP